MDASMIGFLGQASNALEITPTAVGTTLGGGGVVYLALRILSRFIEQKLPSPGSGSVCSMTTDLAKKIESTNEVVTKEDGQNNMLVHYPHIKKEQAEKDLAETMHDVATIQKATLAELQEMRRERQN